MANTNFTTDQHRAIEAGKFLDRIDEEAVYLFIGNHTTPANSQLIDPIVNTNDDIILDTYHSMIAGKRVMPEDTTLGIRNVPYESGKVFVMFDDAAEDLKSQDFYAVVNATSYYHIFKCLDNNGNSVSTITPNFADISGSNTSLYQTSDGYRWKYMYSYSDGDRLKFATGNTIPLFVNATVTAQAVSGAIDIVKVDDPGRGYHNYATGSLRSTDIGINNDSTVFAISNSSVKTVNGYYTGCLFYISSGDGAGQYREVVDYYSNGNGNFIVVNTFFSTSPTNGSEYEIYPKIIFTKSAGATINAEGRALVNSLASNSIYRVEMLNVGQDYTYAESAVAVNAAVGISKPATIRPIISPMGGHGANPLVEFGVRTAVVSVSLANTEGNTIPASSFYRRIGLLENPTFQNVDLSFSDQQGTFLLDEEVAVVDRRRILGSAAVSFGNSTLVSGASDDLREIFRAGDQILIQSSDNVFFQSTTVNSVTNSSSAQLSSNANFSSNATLVYTFEKQGNAVVSNPASGSFLEITNACPCFETGVIVIGLSSSARGTVSDVVRSGVSKTFDTFVQLNKYQGTLVFGEFAENELVTQGDSNVNFSLLHSATTNAGITTILTSNQIGSFSVSNNITGETSGAILSTTAKYQPEAVFGSGAPIYVENLAQIDRVPTQTETFKIVLDF